MNFTKSEKLFTRATRVIPGGVNSPVRAFKSVGGKPVFIERALGSKMWDMDGNEYIDYVGSWGPMILGHAYQPVLDAIAAVMGKGTSFGAVTEREVEMAELICSIIPSIEMVRMVNSGTEATMSAIRLARAYTGRNKILKFDGCYHGHADSFLIKAGSGAATLGIPDSPGVTPSMAQDTLVAEFNNIDSVQSEIQKFPGQVAAVIIEPVVGNMGCILPEKDFLHHLRNLCDKENILLIFDEVMTGFRVSAGGAQELYKIKPDLTTLGKIIGGGLPVGAYGGKKEIMENIAPSGPVYQAGTLSGNPLAMAAGLAMLKALRSIPTVYQILEKSGELLEREIVHFSFSKGFPITVNRVGSMLTIFFTYKHISNAADARTCDTKLFREFFRNMLSKGIYLPPSQFEAAFISVAHTQEDLEKTIDAVKKSLLKIY